MLRWLLFPLLLPFRLLVALWYRITSFLLRGNVLYHRMPSEFSAAMHSGLLYRIISKQETIWFFYLGLLSRMSTDPKLEWIILEFPDLEDLDWSQIEELRIRLGEIGAAGKKLVGHAEKGGLKTLYLLSACERRFLAPGNTFLTSLPHAEPYFFADALKKWGIRVEVHTAGEFKSAGESMSRNSMSPSARENLESLLASRKEQILEGIHCPDSARTSKLHARMEKEAFLDAEALFAQGFAQGLIPASSFRDIAEELLPYWNQGQPLPESKKKPSAKKSDYLSLIQFAEGPGLKEAPVVHAFPGPAEKTVEQLQKELEADQDAPQTPGKDGEAQEGTGEPPPYRYRMIELDQIQKRYGRSRYQPFRIRRYPSIALVSCEGMILWGSEQPESGRVGALPMRRVFKELEESDVEVVFLYINSPGGLSDASEALYQDVYRLSRSKPVFAVLGSVAASGGYYLACAANRIYSPDMSLTGSVGVIRMRPELSGLYKKLGVRKQRIAFGPTTDVMSEDGKLSPKSLALLDESMDRSYTLFLDRVRRNRGISRAEADKKGRGRVYTGRQFREAGMLDRKGGFVEAFRDFKKEAGYADDQLFDMQMYPVLKPGAADLLRQRPSLLSQTRALLSGSNLYLASDLIRMHDPFLSFFAGTGYPFEM
ncbi:MAG: S49 family peptidase [Leptospiraceae bacterium]|nr:S49 family peptidase [Leptospiraceae bacterium]